MTFNQSRYFLQKETNKYKMNYRKWSCLYIELASVGEIQTAMSDEKSFEIVPEPL